jgi:hypothetical protein
MHLIQLKIINLLWYLSNLFPRSNCFCRVTGVPLYLIYAMQNSPCGRWDTPGPRDRDLAPMKYPREWLITPVSIYPDMLCKMMDLNGMH